MYGQITDEEDDDDGYQHIGYFSSRQELRVNRAVVAVTPGIACWKENNNTHIKHSVCVSEMYSMTQFTTEDQSVLDRPPLVSYWDFSITKRVSPVVN